MAEDQYTKIQEEDLKKFLDNPENQHTAAIIALQLRERFGRSWFTLNELKKSTQNNETLETFELPVLKAYGLLKQNGKKYKVTLRRLEEAKRRKESENNE